MEADVSFDKHVFEESDFKDLDRYYYILKETITNDHFYSQFHHKYYRLKFELKIYELCQVVKHLQRLKQDKEDNDDDGEEKNGEMVAMITKSRIAKQSLLEWISALFVYYRKPSHANQKLKEQAFQSLVILAKGLLRVGTHEDRLFLLNHCLRCPAGASTVLAPQLVECPVPNRFVDRDTGKEWIDLACTVIAIILSPVLDRDKYIEPEKKAPPPTTTSAGGRSRQQQIEPWLLVDTDYDDEELVSSAGSELLSEFDIINYLLQVPFEEMLDFVSLIGRFDRQSEEAANDDDENEISSVETAMIKLFAFNTHLIRVLKAGLQNFNCLRYKELTLYIASMVKLIIRKLSANWVWCRQKFTTKDQAMLTRLQVEYDHFMLRSISTLLGTNRRGVWPLLAQIEFDGITESMLWHILWVVYSNGRDQEAMTTAGAGGGEKLCPYMSTNYWKDKLAKFQQWKFVFLEKLSVFSKEEAVGLLEFFFKMGISRSEPAELSLLQEIITRIAELSLVRCCLKGGADGAEKSIANHGYYIDKGRGCLSKLLKKFTKCFTILLQFLEDQGEANLLEEPCLRLFTSLDLVDFVPEPKHLVIINRWLVDFEAKHILNRLARIVLSSLSWSRTLLKVDNVNSLFLGDEMQRAHALKLFEAIEAQKRFHVQAEMERTGKIAPADEKLPSLTIDMFDVEHFRHQLAMATSYHDFVLWTWRAVLELRIHPLQTIPDTSGWDEIIFGRNHYDTITTTSSHQGGGEHYRQHRLFQRLPKMNYDTSLVELKKKVEETQPIATFIGTMMTDHVMKSGGSGTGGVESVARWVKVCSGLAKQGHHLPVVQLIKHFVPLFYANGGGAWTTKGGKKKQLTTSNKFIGVLVDLIVSGHGDLLAAVILYQVKHLINPRNCVLLCSFWTEALVEAVDQCLAEKGGGGGGGSSWRIPIISSLNPFGGGDGNAEMVTMIIDKVTNILDRIAQQLVLGEGEQQLLPHYVKYLLEKASCMSMNKPGNVGWRFHKLNNLTEDIPVSSGGGGSIFSNLFSFGGTNTNENDNKVFKVSYLPDRSTLKSEWITPLHVLLRQNLNRLAAGNDGGGDGGGGGRAAALYLAYVLNEFDMRRCAKLWDHLVYEIHNNPELRPVLANDEVDEKMLAEFESVVKDVCLLFNLPPIPFAMLPINSLLVWLLRAPPLDAKETQASEPHPMLPLLWKNFFVLYFSSSISSPSLGLKFLSRPVMEGLKTKLTILFDWHSRRWLVLSNQKVANQANGGGGGGGGASDSDLIANILFEDRLVKLYRSYQLWLGDIRLHRVYVNLSDGEFSQPEFQAPLLKHIFSIGSQLHGAGHSVAVPEVAIGNAKPDTFFFLNYINKKMLNCDIETLEMISAESVGRIHDRRSASETEASNNEDDDDDSEEEIYLNKKLKQAIENNRREQNATELCTDSETIMKDWTFWPTMEYINSLTNTLEVNLLFADADNVLHLLETMTDAHKPIDPKMLVVLMHQIIVSVVEEARLVESQWSKYLTENKAYCSELLPKLYQEVSKRVTHSVECDREFNANANGGCAGAATLVFEYYQSEMSSYVKQKADHNRLVQQSVVRHLSDEMPTQKIVGLVFLLQKMLNHLAPLYERAAADQLEQKIFTSIGGWFESINTISTRYFVTTQVFDLLLEFLTELGNVHKDAVSYYLLATALNPKLAVNWIQQLAPFLQPSYCSGQCFVRMYQLIGGQLSRVAPQTAFVLLSKFDVHSWLKSIDVGDEQRAEFRRCLYQSLHSYGPFPNDESLVTFDLYRKHLQEVIFYQFPQHFDQVLSFLLAGCHQRTLAPSLWNNVLQTFGFYTRSLSSNKSVIASSVLDFDLVTFDQDLREYTQKQQVFNSHELFELLKSMDNFFAHMERELGDATELLEHYKLYTLRYLPFLAFLSYCWVHANAQPPAADEPENIWAPLVANWRRWLLPKTSTKFIAAEHLDFAWRLFGQCFRFVLDTFDHFRSDFLSKFWQLFLTFIIEQPNRIEQRELASIEEKLLVMCEWRHFTPTLLDIKLMYDSVIQTSYSVERLIAWVLAKIDWRKVLTAPTKAGEVLTFEQLLTVVENLSYVFITLYEHDSIAELNLDSIPFGVLEPTKVKMITLMVGQLMKAKADDILAIFGPHQQKGAKNSSLFLVSLLKTITQVKQPLRPSSASSDDEEQEMTATTIGAPIESLRQEYINRAITKSTTNRVWLVAKHVHYLEAVGLFVVDYCNAHADQVAKESGTIRNLLLNTIETIGATLEALSIPERVRLFTVLLQPLTEVVDEAIRYRLCVHYVTICSYLSSADQLADLIVAVNSTITATSPKCSIYMLESLIENYLDLGGGLDFLVSNLSTGLVGGGGGGSSGGRGSPQGKEQAAAMMPPEAYGQALIQSRSCLVLLVHLYGRLQKATVPEVCTRKYSCSLMAQCGQFRFATTAQARPDEEMKMVLLWFKLVALLTNQDRFVNELESCQYNTPATSGGVGVGGGGASRNPTIINLAVNSMQSLLNQAGAAPSSRIVLDLADEQLYLAVRTLTDLVRGLHSLVEESLSRPLFSFWRSNKHSSNK